VRAVLAEGQAVPPGGDALREEGGQLPRLRPRRRHDGDAAVTQPSHFTYLVSIRPRPPATPQPQNELATEGDEVLRSDSTRAWPGQAGQEPDPGVAPCGRDGASQRARRPGNDPTNEPTESRT